MKTILFLWASFFLSLFSYGQSGIWQKSSQNIKTSMIPGQRLPQHYSIYKVDLSQMKKILKKASLMASKVSLELPDEKGKLISYHLMPSSTLSPALKQVTGIRAYRGYGPHGEIASIVLSPFGIHAGILRPDKPDLVIETISEEQKLVYIFEKKFLPPVAFNCLTETPKPKENLSKSYQRINDGILRTYRFAVGTTGEYAQFHIQQAINNGILSNNATDDEKKNVVLAAVVVTIDRVNSVYERDLGVSLQLVPNEKNVIFLDPDTDPYDNTDIMSMLNSNTNVLNQYIGETNYDGGHLFSTYAGGGISGLGIICSTAKGRSVTGLTNPVGDAYDIDFVAHEIGHAFNCNHTFGNSCGNNRHLATSVEPGSGSTIMAYAGVCSPNVQVHSDDYFSIVSIQEAANFVTNSATCSTNTITGNNAPVINLVNYGTIYIPENTPFMLTATAQDAEGDAMTYSWEQIDPVPDSSANSWVPDATHTGGPEFRSYSPTTLPTRYFPIIANIISGTYKNTWEVLPGIGRSLSFALTVRDNHPGNGQTPFAQLSFNIDPNAGPFRITNLANDEIWQENTTKTVTWDVAGTDANQVNCTSVDILFSADNGVTFPYILAQNVPNNGSAQFTVPDNITTGLGRLMIKGHNNYFFDLAKGKFSLSGSNHIAGNSFNNLRLYPNPVKNKLHVSFDLTTPGQPVAISLWDISGRLIWQKTYYVNRNFEKIFDLNPYQKGLYLIQIQNGIHQIVKKIILK